MTEDIKKTTENVEKSETIEVPKAAFMELVEEVKKLKNGTGSIQKAIEIKEGERTAKIRIYKGLPVVNLKGFTTKSILGPSGKEEIQMVDVYCQDEEGNEVKTGNMDYLDFMNNTETAKIRLKKVVQIIDKSESAGLYDSQNPNPHENKSFISSPINLLVEIKERIFEGQILEGGLKDKIIKISEFSLNM